jgi:hypothetical protein
VVVAGVVVVAVVVADVVDVVVEPAAEVPHPAVAAMTRHPAMHPIRSRIRFPPSREMIAASAGYAADWDGGHLDPPRT